MKSQIAVIGLGQFGASVALELQKLGHNVLAIDVDEKKVNQIADNVSHALILDVTNKESLIEAGLNDFEIAIIAIGAHVQESILCAVLLKEIGVKTIIAKSMDYYHGLILQKVGVEKIISPESEMGVRLARSIASPSVIDYIQLSPGYSVVELRATKSIVGKSLAQLDMRRKANVNVLAIRRGDNLNPVPNGDDVVGDNDILIVAGRDKDLEHLKD
ncbi:MAG: TrkA family potassium uptake protein [bacterium]